MDRKRWQGLGLVVDVHVRNTMGGRGNYITIDPPPSGVAEVDQVDAHMVSRHSDGKHTSGRAQRSKRSEA